MLVGCGLLETRDPEPPVNSGSQFEPATTPSLVLRNLENALLHANAGDYRKCFGDSSKDIPSLLFQPSIQGSAAAPSKFSNWGISEEEDYIRNIFAELQKGSVCSVSFS